MADRRNCTEVTPSCPVEATLYGYAPSLGWNRFFITLFAVFCFVNLVLGIRYRTWTYMVCLHFHQDNTSPY